MNGFVSGERYRHLSLRAFVLASVALFVGTFTLLPLFSLVWNSFKPVRLGRIVDFSLENFTLRNYSHAYLDPATFTMLANSFIFALGSMVVAFLIGGTLAVLVERTNVSFKNVIYATVLIPLIMPGVLKAISWILLLNPNIGLLNQIWFLFGSTRPLFYDDSIFSMIWVEGISMVPMTYLLLGASFKMMDPSLEEAAYASGAGKWQVFGTVTLKLMTPAMAGVCLLNFIRGLEAFEVPLIMGFGAKFQVFSTNIYYSVRLLSPPDYGLALAYSMLLVIIATIGLYFYHRIMKASYKYTTITGKGFRPRLIDLGKWQRACGLVTLALIGIPFVLPVLLLCWASLLPLYQNPSWEAISLVSLKNYRELMEHGDFILAVKNSLQLGLMVGLGGMLIATLVSWTVIKLRPKGSGALDFLSFVSYAIPGIVVGISFMIVFLAFPNPLYGTIWLMALAYWIHFLPIATRFTHAGIAQISAELEDAAATSGAGFMTTIRTITLPLIVPFLVSGGLYLFILTSKLLSVVAILYTPESVIFPVYIMRLYDEGFMPQVAALGVVMIFGIGFLTLVVRKLGARSEISHI
jgi:iron(III) transport system permease protein